jgi:diguanylate cyclase (GGDEF)-like protein
LTGIANRRSFDDTIGIEWRRAVRNGLPLSLLMLDVDYFKPYNDAYGHPAGDRCLRTVAEIIDSCVKRAGDLAARYGGEEFAVVLPHTDAEEARLLAQKVCDAVSGWGLEHGASAIAGHVTVSVGVATRMVRDDVHEEERDGDRSALAQLSLIDAADKALYEAKSAGRNRIASATI